MCWKDSLTRLGLQLTDDRLTIEDVVYDATETVFREHWNELVFNDNDNHPCVDCSNAVSCATDFMACRDYESFLNRRTCKGDRWATKELYDEIEKYDFVRHLSYEELSQEYNDLDIKSQVEYICGEKKDIKKLTYVLPSVEIYYIIGFIEDGKHYYRHKKYKRLERLK